MTPLLILTHGDFGPVLLRSAEAMYGSQQQILALPLSAEETPEAFAGRVDQAKAALKGEPLVLVDLSGGTPWNVALTRGCASGRGEILAGLSLPLLLEALGLRDAMNPRELAAELARRAPGTFARASQLLERARPQGDAQ